MIVLVAIDLCTLSSFVVAAIIITTFAMALLATSALVLATLEVFAAVLLHFLDDLRKEFLFCFAFDE